MGRDPFESSFFRLCKTIMEGLRIAEHADKRAEKCSGGTKRKLSYGMAMLGDPKIVLMDEPSTGMDPQSKRFVWDTILASFKVRSVFQQISNNEHFLRVSEVQSLPRIPWKKQTRFVAEWVLWSKES